MPEILHLDAHILVVNKPAGWLVIPDGYDPQAPNLRDHLSTSYGRLWVVHRLDKETSGVLLFARSAEAHRALNNQFSGRQIEKHYRLLAMGQAQSNSLAVDLPLRINADRAHRTSIDPERGKPASTLFQVQSRFPGGIIELIATPSTGYTHQIRAHAAAAGFWLINDQLYFPWTQPPANPGARPHLPVEYRRMAENLPIKRLALHADAIGFIHPATRQPQRFSAPTPRDYQAALECLSEAGRA